MRTCSEEVSVVRENQKLCGEYAIKAYLISYLNAVKDFIITVTLTVMQLNI